MDRRDEEQARDPDAPRPGTQVGLGRVVENRSGLGEKAKPGELLEPDVDASSDASFPASDPPSFMGDPPTPHEGAPTGPPDPPDGP